MKSMKLLAGATLLSGSILLTGCPVADPRTSNQGGGSILSAGTKIAGGNISGLTPDEIQIIGDAATSVNEQVPTLSDEQADAISEFLVANNINSVDDVQAVVDDPGMLVIPEGLEELFSGGAFEQSSG